MPRHWGDEEIVIVLTAKRDLSPRIESADWSADPVLRLKGGPLQRRY